MIFWLLDASNQPYPPQILFFQNFHLTGYVMKENSIFSKSWWLFLLKGILALSIGLIALIKPTIAFTSLVFILGIYMIIEGLIKIFGGLKASSKNSFFWVWLLISGAVSTAMGIFTFLNPTVTAITLIYFIAGWAVLAGIAEITTAIRLQRVINGESWYLVSGILSFIFGAIVFLKPSVGILSFTLFFGFYALTAGILHIYLSTRLWMRHVRIIMPRFSLYN